MRSEEAGIGKRVRVRKAHRRAELRGREGTIAKSWGDPGYPALDILLDDGDWQLFWYHELEPVEGTTVVHDDDKTGQPRERRRTIYPPQGPSLV